MSVAQKTLLEDGSVTYAALDFTFTAGNAGAFESVKVIGNPTKGDLSLSGSAVTNNQVIPSANLANLKYTPRANENGAAYVDLVAIEVGNSVASSVFRANFDITPVNDVPSVSLTAVTNLAGVTWGATAASQELWQSLASSSNGQKLVGVVDGGRIFTSSEAGLNWVARDTLRNWQDVASSADGAKLVAVVQGGLVYTSADSGATWTPRAGAGYSAWSSVASSADGSAIVATVSAGKIYSSSDSGATWISRATDLNWSDIASSNDGTNLVASVNGGFIYTSTDRGTNWTQRASEKLWTAVSSSANGSKLVAAVQNGAISTSSDGGVNWVVQASAGDRDWSSLASSADGAELIGSVFGGKLYTSLDSGVTWTARADARNWSAVAASADGGALVASVYGGLLYRSSDEVVPSSVTFVEDSGQFTKANFFLASSAGPENESSQTLSFGLSGFNAGSFLVAPAISSAGTLTFTPATNFIGTEIVTVKVSDNGGTANTGVDTADPTGMKQFKIVITNTDDAPVLAAFTINGTEDVVVAFTSSTFTTNYTTIDTIHDHMINGLAGIARSRIEMAAFAATRAGANAVAEAVRASGLAGTTGLVGGVYFESVMLDSGIQTLDERPTDGTQQHRYITVFDYLIAYQESY